MVAVENDARQVLADVVADRVPAVVAQGSGEDLKDPLKVPPILEVLDRKICWILSNSISPPCTSRTPDRSRWSPLRRTRRCRRTD